MMFSIQQMFWLLLIYSFLGWCAEVSFQAIAHGKIVNRGFLNGPICPIYGVGMVGVLLLLQPVADNIIWLFMGGMFFATSVELIGGAVLDCAFHMRWWDYSKEPYNFRGYICLRFSVIWGLAVVGAVRIIHPPIMWLVNLVPERAGLVFTIIAAVILATDLAVTLRSVIGLRKDMGSMARIVDNLQYMSDNLTVIVSSSALRVEGNIVNMKAKTEEAVEKQVAAAQEKQQEINEKIENAKAEAEQQKAEAREKFLAEAAYLERKYNLQKRKIRKHFGRRRWLRAYPQLRRSDSRKTMQSEINLLDMIMKSVNEKKSNNHKEQA